MPLACVSLEGHKGNEKEDALAHNGASMAMTDQEPLCLVAKASTKTSIIYSLQTKSQDVKSPLE